MEGCVSWVKGSWSISNFLYRCKFYNSYSLVISLLKHQIITFNDYGFIISATAGIYYTDLNRYYKMLKCQLIANDLVIN